MKLEPFCSFWGWKWKWEEVGARILLSDNTGGETVILWLARFECVGIWISTGLLYICTYAHGWTYIYSVPNSAIFNLGRTYLLKSISVCTDEQTVSCTVRKIIPNLSFINRLKKKLFSVVWISVCTSQRTELSTTKVNHLLLFWKILVVDSENRTKRTVSTNFIFRKCHNYWWVLVTIGL